MSETLHFSSRVICFSFAERDALLAVFDTMDRRRRCSFLCVNKYACFFGSLTVHDDADDNRARRKV